MTDDLKQRLRYCRIYRADAEEAADALDARDAEIARLREQLAYADEHARKIEALLDAHIDWRAALKETPDHD